MGHNKYQFLIPGKPPPFLITPKLFIFLESAATLPYTHLQEPLHPTLDQLPGPNPHPLHSPWRWPLACGRSTAGAEPAGLVLLRRRGGPPSKLRHTGRGGAGGGSGHEMHLLNKRRPWWKQGNVEEQSGVPTAPRLQEGSWWPRGTPPAAGGWGVWGCSPAPSAPASGPKLPHA